MSVTSIILLSAIGLLLAWEVYVLIARKETISQSIWAWTKQTSLVPFLFGLLMGHFFW